MTDPFAVEVAVRRFTFWRGALAALALAAIGSEAGWAWSRSTWLPSQQSLVAIASGMVIVGIVASLWRVPVGLLCCAEGKWRFTADAAPGRGGAGSAAAAADVLARGQRVEVEVAIDLGSFVLLRLRPVPPPMPDEGVRWLPVQRRGLEGRWQALRCALYQPRPGAEAEPSRQETTEAGS